MRRFLVTGGAGSFGSAFASRMRDAEVFCYSRDPLKHDAVSRTAGPRFFPIVGSVLDFNRLLDTMIEVRPDVVIHAAALKHLVAGEFNPRPYIETNAIGTHNVAMACRRAGVKVAILISTDKAVEPVNVYGLTKALAERVWSHESLQDETAFLTIRLGNVLDARGSVLRVWIEESKKGEPLTVRSPAPTRFVLSLSEVVDRVIELADIGEAGMEKSGIFVPCDLPAVNIEDMARAISQKIVHAPLAPGEKQHEVLISAWETRRTAYQGKFYRVMGRTHIPMEPYSSETARFLDAREVVFERFKYLWKE